MCSSSIFYIVSSFFCLSLSFSFSLSLSSAAKKAAADDAAVLEAVISGDLEAVERLILDGAFAASSCADQQLRTPLHYAAYNGDRDMAALLIDYDAHVEATDATVKKKFKRGGEEV